MSESQAADRDALQFITTAHPDKQLLRHFVLFCVIWCHRFQKNNDSGGIFAPDSKIQCPGAMVTFLRCLFQSPRQYPMIRCARASIASLIPHLSTLNSWPGSRSFWRGDHTSEKTLRVDILQEAATKSPDSSAPRQRHRKHIVLFGIIRKVFFLKPRVGE